MCIYGNAGRVVGLFQKPANLEDAKTPENKLVSKKIRSVCVNLFSRAVQEKMENDVRINTFTSVTLAKI